MIGNWGGREYSVFKENNFRFKTNEKSNIMFLFRFPEISAIRLKREYLMIFLRMVRGHNSTERSFPSFSSKSPIKYAYLGSKPVVLRLFKSGMRKYSPVALKPGANESTGIIPNAAFVIPTDRRVEEVINERN